MKTPNLYCALFFIVLLTACGSGLPKGVLPPEKMQTILWDVALAGEYANGFVYYQKPLANRASVNETLMKEIYRIHGITKQDFEKSLEYYRQKPHALLAILDSITARQSAAPPQPPVEVPTSMPGGAGTSAPSSSAGSPMLHRAENAPQINSAP